MNCPYCGKEIETPKPIIGYYVTVKKRQHEWTIPCSGSAKYMATFTPEMVQYEGKSFLMEEFAPDWFRVPIINSHDNAYIWHRSWLEFTHENTKNDNPSSHIRRITLRKSKNKT